MARIEHGPAAFRREVERILRQIVFSATGCEAEPVMLNEETSSMECDHVYEARKESP